MNGRNAKTVFNGVKFVFLDRDGVINKKLPENKYVCRWSDFLFLPYVADAIAKLNASGLRIIVVTNQRGIALGLYGEEELLLIHRKLEESLRDDGAHIDAIYYCPHDTRECGCRKPGVGLFLKAFAEFPEATSANAVMIGDSLSDIQAAAKLGMRSILIKGETATQKPGTREAEILADATATSLFDAVDRYF